MQATPLSPTSSPAAAASAPNKMSNKWFTLPNNLHNYATQLSDYIQKKEYNNEDDFMTYQMLYLKLKDIEKSFSENKVLANFIPDEELQAVFKRKLIRYRTQFIDLKNEFAFMLDQILLYKKQKKMFSSINISTSRDSSIMQSDQSSQFLHQQDSPLSKKEANMSSSGQKKSIKTVLLLLTSQFKENVKKIKPVYDEIVKLTPSLIENLQNTIQKQFSLNLSKQNSANQNENNQRGSFASQQSQLSFNSSGFSISAKIHESLESIMKTILQLAQTIKSQIREIENLTSNMEDFNEKLSKFKSNKVAFFNCIGAIEIYWMLRFDNVSDFFQQEIKSLQKGMDRFLVKLKQIISKQMQDNSSSSSIRQKKTSQDSQQYVERHDSSKVHSVSSTNQQDNISDSLNSYSSQELYYTAKSYQLQKHKISEQIVLEQIPEEDIGKQTYTYTQSNFGNTVFQYQSIQSDLESKYDNDNQQYTHAQSENDNDNEKYSFNSNFQFVLKQCENQESQFKSILSNSDIFPKESSPTKAHYPEDFMRSNICQTQSFAQQREQREFSKSFLMSSDKKENKEQDQSNIHQSTSQKSTSTRSQINPSGISEKNSSNKALSNNDKKEIQKSVTNDRIISGGFCFCISRVV